jgi:chlorite dismutase
MSNATDLGFTQDDMTPGEGWHCSHFFYSFDRTKIVNLRETLGTKFDEAKADFAEVIETAQASGTERFQLGLTSGHKADFSLMLMDPDPIKIESVHQQLLNSKLGQAIQTTWSYVSISEISEYALSVPQYAERLKREGEDPESSAFQKKIAAYTGRVGKMNFQRLTPHFADWPVSCFYPMNKWRLPGANWFAQPSSARQKMMSEHARSGIKFAGKVTQLITVGVGFDDWEWGVTLWATNPKYLKDIVYEMRFDEASAKYAEFGPFYTSYKATANQILDVCRI